MIIKKITIKEFIKVLRGLKKLTKRAINEKYINPFIAVSENFFKLLLFS